jgi:hypothetical protein
MKAKTVTGTDRRVWHVSRHIMLRMPASADEHEFEHDVEGGRIGMGVIMVLLVMFLVALLTWKGAGDLPIHLPPWLKAIMVLILLFFPVRWLLRRPWKLVAHTNGGRDPVRQEMLAKETWEGTVRGFNKARDECALVINTIKKRGRLSKADGLMKKIS